jgi:hypothetical protein
MKKVTYLIVLIVLIISPTHSLASESIFAKVIQAGKYGSGKLLVVLDTEISEPGCAAPRFDVAADHPAIDSFLSIALAAAASGAEVKVRTNGCLGSYPTMDQTEGSIFYFKKG